MPAKRKTNADRLRERFESMYKVGKAITRLRDTEIAEFLDISVTSLWSRKKDPSKFTVGELSKLASVLRWQEEDILKLFSILQ